MKFRPALFGSTLHDNQFSDVTVRKSDYDITELIMTQKLEPRTAGLKPTKIGLVDRVIVY